MKTTHVHKTIYGVLAALLLLVGALCAAACSTNAGTGGRSILVTEIVSSNKYSLVDEDVGTPDWIELYNPTGADIDLTGYGVSDNMKKLHKYVFPEGTVIHAGEYMVIYAGSNNGVTATTIPCTGFGLSKSGDYLFLTDPYYNLIAEMQIPSLVSDISYARRSDGTLQ